MVDISLVVNLIIFSLALIGVFLGAIIVTKSQGKLRLSVLSLTIALIFFFLYEIGNIFELYTEMVNNFLWIGVIILMLFALININGMISNVKNYSERKRKSNAEKKKK
jgi:hypothetical protein